MGVQATCCVWRCEPSSLSMCTTKPTNSSATKVKKNRLKYMGQRKSKQIIICKGPSNKTRLVNSDRLNLFSRNLVINGDASPCRHQHKAARLISLQVITLALRGRLSALLLQSQALATPTPWPPPPTVASPTPLLRSRTPQPLNPAKLNKLSSIIPRSLTKHFFLTLFF